MSADLCELGQIIRLSKRGANETSFRGVKIFAWLMSLLWQICGFGVAVVAERSGTVWRLDLGWVVC